MLDPETKQTAPVAIHANIFYPWITITCMHTIKQLSKYILLIVMSNPMWTHIMSPHSFISTTQWLIQSICRHDIQYSESEWCTTADQWPAILLFFIIIKLFKKNSNNSTTFSDYPVCGTRVLITLLLFFQTVFFFKRQPAAGLPIYFLTPDVKHLSDKIVTSC